LLHRVCLVPTNSPDDIGLALFHAAPGVCLISA
jgi:hypothetical protein